MDRHKLFSTKTLFAQTEDWTVFRPVIEGEQMPWKQSLRQVFGCMGYTEGGRW